MADTQFSADELNLIRQWFDVAQDMTDGYLETPDYVLAARIYTATGFRVPNSIADKIPPTERG